MAKSKKITVYPDPYALAILGDSTPALNQAVECWARVIAEATHDNAKDLDRSEWNYLADVCNGLLTDTGIGNPSVYLWARAEDGHRLDHTGYKWFAGEGVELEASAALAGGGKATKAMRDADARVATMVEKLRGFDYAHAWAALVAIQFFWDYPEAIDHAKDEWWMLPFRRRILEAE